MPRAITIAALDTLIGSDLNYPTCLPFTTLVRCKPQAVDRYGPCPLRAHGPSLTHARNHRD